MGDDFSPELIAGRAAAPIRDQWAHLVRPTEAAERFDTSVLAPLPDPARRWLSHAIAPGSPLTSTSLLEMQGQLRLGPWLPMRAVEAVSPPAGLVWVAQVEERLGGDY